MSRQNTYNRGAVLVGPHASSAVQIRSIPTLVVIRWPLERVLFALAGTMTLIAAAPGALVSKWFLLLAALVGVNQWLYALFGACPASIVLRRTCRLRSAIYPNRGPAATRPAREEVTV